MPRPHRESEERIAPEDVAFVLCIEANRLEPQGLMLCESVRRFAGRYADARIVAISPRPALRVGPRTRSRLAELDVEYRALPLNETGHAYGTINRVAMGAWAEAHVESAYLVVLDTDMLFVSAPEFVSADAGLRPVDMKGSASAGSGDPVDAYWQGICDLAGIAPDCLPFLRSSVGGESIRASYNGGFAIVRRSCGILRKTSDVFFASLDSGLRPYEPGRNRVRASTGDVGPEAASWWGSSQAALSAAVWSCTQDVRLYDSRYNIPLHLLKGRANAWPSSPSGPPVLVHYHHLAEAGHRDELQRALSIIGCPAQSLAWTADRVHLFDDDLM